MIASSFSGGSDLATKDRRRAERQRIDAPGELRACPADARSPAMEVEVRDVSATGVGIVHDVPLPVGQKYVVTQDALPPDWPRLFTVVRSETTPDGRYSIGLHASSLLDPHADAHAQRHRSGGKARAVLMLLASVLFLLAIAALMMY